MKVEDLVFRPVITADLPLLFRWSADAWQLEAFGGGPRAQKSLRRASTMALLARQNYSLVALANGRPAGFLFSRIGSLPADASREWAPHLLYHLPQLWGIKKNVSVPDKWALVKGLAQIAACIPAKGSYSAELVLFITAPQLRGRGVGKALLARFERELAELGGRNYYLTSDSFANYGFYDANGYMRRGEGGFPFLLRGRPKEYRVYVYSKNLAAGAE